MGVFTVSDSSCQRVSVSVRYGARFQQGRARRSGRPRGNGWLRRFGTLSYARGKGTAPPENMSAEAPAAKKLKGEDGGAVAAGPAAPAEPARAEPAPSSPADAPEAAVEHATERELTPTEMAVQKQIEFYFSDANLRKDQFLRFQASQTHEGWVPILSY